jgi:hypothetical protein
MAFTAVPRQSSKRILNQQHRESDVTMLHAMRLGELTIRQSQALNCPTRPTDELKDLL